MTTITAHMCLPIIVINSVGDTNR